MISIETYKIVESIEEAYTLNQSKNNLIIGGMCWVKMPNKQVKTAIDMSNLGLDLIEEFDDYFKIGAMTSLRNLETNTQIKKYFGDGISESLCHIVGTQFRNCATLGASVFMRFPFSDIVTSLLALNAKVQLHEKGRITLEEFMKMPLDRDILTHIILEKQPIKMKYLSLRNSYTDFPILTVGVSQTTDGIQVAVGARPQRAELIKDSENILGTEITKEKAETFATFVATSLSFGTNQRGSAQYRKHLCKVLVQRGILALNGDNENEN
ncbi:MAG: FAD binding domain-containing protein [Anaerotignum sp.]